MRWLGLLVVLLFVAGCTTTVEGSGSAAESDGVVLPPRPREVRIEAVDPCSLLTEQQRGELGLDGEPSLGTEPSALFGGEEAACVIRGFRPRAVMVGIGIVTTAGIDLFASGDMEADVSALQVRGFPAILAVPTRLTRFCSVFVDVAPGQMLDIQYSDGGGQPTISQDQLCLGAQALADATMVNLLAR